MYNRGKTFLKPKNSGQCCGSIGSETASTIRIRKKSFWIQAVPNQKPSPKNL